MLFNEVIEAQLIIKFNPYHDAKGRFTSGKGAHSVSNKAGEKFATALGMKAHGHNITREEIHSQVAHMLANKGGLAGWVSPTQTVKNTKEALNEVVEATGQVPKSKSAAKTAAAVIQASKTPDDAPRKAVDTMPKASDLTLITGTHLGGTGAKSVYQDKDGNQYLFKPSQTKSGTAEPFRADVQEAASKLGRMIKDNPLDTVEVRKITLQGKEGTIQKVLPSTGDASALHPNKMTDKQRNDLLQEHTVDWMLGNFDSHGGNFIQMRNGRLLGVDKEQAFRYIGDAKSQKMSTSYAPNKSYGTADPIYNNLFKGHAEGKYKLDLQGLDKQIKRVEAIPDAKYREMFRGYAEGLHGKGTKAEALLDQIVTRKQGIRGEYERFFSSLETSAAKSPQQFTFKEGTKEVQVPATAKATKATLAESTHVHSAEAPEPFKGKTVSMIAQKGPAYWETVLSHSTATEIKSLAKELGIRHKGDIGATQAAISAHYKKVAGPDTASKYFPNKVDLENLSKKALHNLAFKEGIVDASGLAHKAQYVTALNNHYQAKLADLKAPTKVNAQTPSALSSKTVVDLKAMAKAAGLKGYSSMTKEQLIAALSGGGKAGLGTFKGYSLTTAKGEYLGSVTNGHHLSAEIANHDNIWGSSTHTSAEEGATHLVAHAAKAGATITADHAKTAVSAVKDFTGSSYGEIRKKQRAAIAKGKQSPGSKGALIDEVIELSPKWDGNGTLTRKIKVDPADAPAFWAKHKEGNIIDQLGSSSWSSSSNVWSGNVHFIMQGGSMMGASVKNISHHTGEDEIVLHSGARQFIDKIEHKQGTAYIYVSEVPPVTPSSLSTLLKSSDVIYFGKAKKEGGSMIHPDDDESIDVRDRVEEAAYAVYDQASQEWTTSDGGPGPAPKTQEKEDTKPE